MIDTTKHFKNVYPEVICAQESSDTRLRLCRDISGLVQFIRVTACHSSVVIDSWYVDETDINSFLSAQHPNLFQYFEVPEL
jgi:hypothetical protein